MQIKSFLYLFQPQLFQVGVVLVAGFGYLLVDVGELLVDGFQVNGRFFLGETDIARDVEVVAVVADFGEFYAAAETVFLAAVAVGLDDVVDVFVGEVVLFLAFFETFCCVDEEDVVVLAAFLQDDNADGYASGVEQVAGQPYDAVDAVVLDEFGSNAFFGTATEQHAVGQDERHGAVAAEVVEAVEQEGEVSGALRRYAVVGEAWVARGLVVGFPAEAEGRVGHDGIKEHGVGGVLLAEQVPVVGEGVAVEDFKLRVAEAMQQHVHAGEVEGGHFLFLTVNLANLAAVEAHLPVDVEQQRSRTAGEVEDSFQLFLVARCGVLAVEGDDAREDGADGLRRVELAGFLAAAGGKLADEVFVGVAQHVGFVVEGLQVLVELGDDAAHHRVAAVVVLAEFLALQVDFGEQPLEGAFERVFLDVLEALGEALQKVFVLGAGQFVDGAPEVLRPDDEMDAVAHHLFEFLDVVVGGFGVPLFEGHVVGQVVAEFEADAVFVAAAEVAEEEQRQHVVAEVVGGHGATERVGHVPKGLEQLFFFLFFHISFSLCIHGVGVYALSFAALIVFSLR